MTLQDGDVVRFDYALYVDSKKPVETSSKDIATKHGILDPEAQYRPLTITVGARQIITGLEEELRERAASGAEFSVEIPPEKAYGEREAAKLKDVPMAEFRKQKVQPEVGLILNYQGERAVISRVAGGRVRLDMNHELAGKTLRYDVQVRDIVEDDNEKVEAVLGSIFNGGAPFTFEDGDEKTVRVELPDGAKFDQQWGQHKFRLLTLLRQAVGVDVAIELVERYPAMKPEPVDPSAELAAEMDEEEAQLADDE